MQEQAVQLTTSQPTENDASPASVCEPSSLYVLLLAIAASALFWSCAFSLGRFPSMVDNFGDSQGYMSVAAAIRHWDFSHLVVKQFWGYPYAMAAFSLFTGGSERAALLVISYISFLLGVVLAHRLWGGWAAGFFAVVNFDWLQRAMLGGSEPLFVALLFGAFLLVRRERWIWASLLASFATVVRPLGLFALLAIGLVLLRRRQFKALAFATLIGVVVGGLYAWPLAHYVGDPLATVHSYTGESRWLFGIPFAAIVEGTIWYPAPWTNLVLSFGWIALVTGGAAAMIFTPAFRRYADSFPVEVLFAVPYLLLLYCYNYPVFARGSFARFSIPVVPMVFFALQRWLPKNRLVLPSLAVACPILAAVSALGLRNVLHLLK